MIHSKFITVGVGGAIPIKGNSASCNLIPTEHKKWILIDAGFGCARNISAMGIPFGDISEIIITHYHNDHFSDLPTVLFAMFMSSSRTSCDVYVPPEDLNFLESMLNDTFQHLFHTINMATGKTVKVNFRGMDELTRLESANVEGVKVQHGNTPTYGLVIAYENSTIGFSSDTVICNGLNEIAERSDHLVLDCSFSQDFGHNPLHATADQLAEFISNYQFELVALNHMMPETIGKEKKILEIIQDRCSGNVIIAKDMEEHLFE